MNFNEIINLTEEKLNDCTERCQKNNQDELYNAIYVRESTRKQAIEGFNLDTQIKRCNEYCNYKGIDKTKIYKESGASAKTTNRKQMNQLKEDIKKGKVKRVIVYKLDRLVRRLKGLSELLELFNLYDVELVSVQEDINTHTAMGRMLMNIIIMIAEWEEDTISERTIDGLIEGAEQGFYMKGSKPPFGYERVTVGKHSMLKVNKEEKRLIHKANGFLKSGYSMYMIKVIINDDKYMKEHNKTFCENQIVNILKNKISMGIMVLNKKDYKLKMNETIFTKEEFDEVQTLLAERGHDSKYNYLYSCKIRSVEGFQSSKKSTVKKSGAILYYFDIQQKKRINEKYITQAVLQYISNNEVLYRAERQRTYESDLRALNMKKKNLEKSYALENISKEAYEKELLKINEIEKEINALKVKYIDCVGTYFNSLKFKEQERIVWKHIKYIEVDYKNKEVTKIC